MIITMDFVHQGESIFHYEFKLPDESSVVEVAFDEGAKMGIDEFRRARTGVSLFDVKMSFGSK